MKLLIGIYSGLILLGGAPLLIYKMKQLGLNKQREKNIRFSTLFILWFSWANAMIFSGFLGVGVIINYGKKIVFGFITLTLLNIILFIAMEIYNKNIHH